MLTSKAQRQIRSIGRMYADGLIKYEPGALGQIELPDLGENDDFKSMYQKAIESIDGKDLSAAIRIADSFKV